MARLRVYLEPRDAWIGVYVAPAAVYVCPLPFVVIRWDRAPSAACVAHGCDKCRLCSIGARDCTACETGPETGHHWDTCANRVRTTDG